MTALATLVFGSSATSDRVRVTDLVVMGDRESLIDEKKVAFINQAGSDYADIDCSLQNAESKKCFQIRNSLHHFVLSMKEIRERMNKCEDMGKEGLYSSPGNSAFMSCLTEIDTAVVKVVDKHYTELNELGYSPSQTS